LFSRYLFGVGELGGLLKKAEASAVFHNPDKIPSPLGLFGSLEDSLATGIMAENCNDCLGASSLVLLSNPLGT